MSIPSAKHATFPAEFMDVQSGTLVAIPERFRKPFHVPPA
ncbi:hypothetical protein SBA7_1220005 [Candidatus Sulfotelmatobacter sp. SbA7]|nr:hypothetical protein SBA7_1220005 [Candidatus Sulfotelmatobacter sp. SbA7]